LTRPRYNMEEIELVIKNTPDALIPLLELHGD